MLRHNFVCRLQSSIPSEHSFMSLIEIIIVKKKNKAYSKIKWKAFKLTNTLIDSRLISKSVLTLTDFIQNVQALKGSNSIKARLICNIAVCLTRFTFIHILAFHRWFMEGVTRRASEKRNLTKFAIFCSVENRWKNLLKFLFDESSTSNFYAIINPHFIVVMDWDCILKS